MERPPLGDPKKSFVIFLLPVGVLHQILWILQMRDELFNRLARMLVHT